VKRSLPRVRNEQIRRILEAKCRDALAKYAAQAELQEAGSGAVAARSGPDQRKQE
jgi:hypothetical protein